MHRLRGVRTRMPGRGDHPGQRAGRRKMARAQPAIFGELAQYHAQEALTRGCRRVEGHRRQVRQVLQPQSRGPLSLSRELLGGSTPRSGIVLTRSSASAAWLICWLASREYDTNLTGAYRTPPPRPAA